MFRIVRMSSKGQIVIPSEIREKFRIKEGDNFVVIPLSSDILVLKKIILDTEAYRTFKKEFTEALKTLGININEEIVDKAFNLLIKKFESD